jgi:DNA-binding beta-propeller fold protein YncE
MSRFVNTIFAAGNLLLSLICVYCPAWAKQVTRVIAAGQAEVQTAAPAETVAETRLGPAAGNGTHPFAAAVDTRRNRLWVLNQIPQSLSVVDLAAQKVVGYVPLSAPAVPEFDGWGNSAPYIWIGYDDRSDRILVGAGGGSVRGVLVSVEAGTRRIEAVRTFKDCLSYRWAMNPKRGEVIVAGMGKAYRGGFGLLIMDAKTLKTRADFATNRQTEAMATCKQTGRLYTVEPSNPNPATCGMGGPYSSTRVFVRNPVSGAIVAQSPGDYAYPGALFVDDESNRLYLVHRNTDLHSIGSELNTVTVISESTLNRERTIHYADQSPNGRPLVGWVTTYFDAPRHRLVVDLFGGTLAILQLTGPAKATELPVEGGKNSDYRLAGVLQRQGQSILLIDNAVRLLNPLTLQSSASIRLGATIQDLFLDIKRQRLLAYADSGMNEFLMLENNLFNVRLLFNSSLQPNTQLLAVDFDRESIFSVYSGGRGTGASLDVVEFHGEKTASDSEAEGELSGLILTNTPGRSIRLLAPRSESVFALPRCSLDLLTEGREVKSVALPQLSSTNRPSQLLYAAQADRVYVVYGQTMAVYSCSDLTALGTISLSALPYDRMRSGLQGSLAVDSAGEFAYFADMAHNQIAKLRLSDGSIVARRDLGFAPALPLVDSSAERLYLADNIDGRVVAIRLF